MGDAHEPPSQPDPAQADLAQADLGRTDRRRKLINTRVGNYTLCDYLGDGGMGTVYKSQQDSPRRFVAVKILSSGLLSESGPAEFLAEANRLGRLQHPNIAQIYEAGTHEEGPISLPFYAMELVRDGLPISAYVQEQKLGFEQIVRLFLSVCDAVMHAHAQGIFHCDLKPGNILVDANGTVKVIDFGIARAADTEQPGKTMNSSSALIRGTPQYMSPEQFSARDGAVTERSDVYSMGVVLYELLCRQLPYNVSRKDMLEAVRTVAETPPIKPRTVNPKLGAGTEAVLLQCLRKDPAERYESVALLREDLVRLLVDESSVRALDRPRIAQAVSQTKKRVATNRLLTSLIALPAIWIICALTLPTLDSRQLANMFEAFAVTHVPHFADVPLADVRVIAVTSDDLKPIARDLKVEGLDLSANKALRGLDGALMRKLARADCGARVLVWDFSFSGATPFDEAFASGARELEKTGTPIIVGKAMWYADSQLPPDKVPSPTIAGSGVRYGGLTADLSEKSAWQIDLACKRGNDASKPSIALLGASACWFGSAPVVLEMDIEGLAVRADKAVKWVDVSGLSGLTPGEVSAGLGFELGDITANYAVEMPSDASLAKSTLDYAAVAAASDQQLRTWFNHKAILIGDARPGRDGPHPYPGGRFISGFFVNAVALQRLLDEQPIRCVEMVTIAGARTTVAIPIAICSAIAGVVLGSALAKRTVIRLLIELLVLAALLGGALEWYSFAGQLHCPAVGMMVLVITTEAVAAIKRLPRKANGLRVA